MANFSLRWEHNLANDSDKITLLEDGFVVKFGSYGCSIRTEQVLPQSGCTTWLIELTENLEHAQLGVFQDNLDFNRGVTLNNVSAWILWLQPESAGFYHGNSKMESFDAELFCNEIAPTFQFTYDADASMLHIQGDNFNFERSFAVPKSDKDMYVALAGAHCKFRITKHPMVIMCQETSTGHIACSTLDGGQIGEFLVPEGQQPFGDWLGQEILKITPLQPDEQLRLVDFDSNVVCPPK